MNRETARALSALTTDFYQRVSASFGATRQSAWPGWERVAKTARLDARSSLDVLDLACGNLRFEHFLAGQGLTVRAWAYDGCDELVREGAARLGDASTLAFTHLDIAQALFEGPDLSAALAAPPVDLAVCFGFMHHVALPEHRAAVVRALVDAVRPGGYVAISFWQFELSPRIMAKARPVPGGDPGDYLLGWQDEPDVWRYCHSFSEEEVDELARACGAQAEEVARFSADGRTGNLNRYLVLRRRA